MRFTESCPSGRRSTIGNRVYAESVSWVQIPDSPPELSAASLGAPRHPYGGVAEWLNAAVSKTVWPLGVTRVRIPPPPPSIAYEPPARGSFHIKGTCRGFEPRGRNAPVARCGLSAAKPMSVAEGDAGIPPPPPSIAYEPQQGALFISKELAGLVDLGRVCQGDV